jgi:hypothetical protein
LGSREWLRAGKWPAKTLPPVVLRRVHRRQVGYPLAARVGSGAAIGVDDCQHLVEVGGREPEHDERVALHEIGGHALVGRLLGNELGGVTCDPGPDFGGLTWGPKHDRRAKFSSQDASSICAVIGPKMPGPGEPRGNAADIYLHVHSRVVELVAGSVAEALFLTGEPWPADSDRAQERALASLTCSSPESIEAFIGFCRVEAAALLRPQEHIVRALTVALLTRRTMSGAEVDEVIAAAITAQAVEDERQRRADWTRRCANASTFKPDVYVPKTF